MASFRTSMTPTPPSPASAETWAVRISFGIMMAGMAAFVIYDLLDPGPANASAEIVEAQEEPPGATVDEFEPPPTPKERRRSQPRFSRLGDSTNVELPSRAAALAPPPDEAELEPADDGSHRSLLGSPAARISPINVPGLRGALKPDVLRRGPETSALSREAMLRDSVPSEPVAAPPPPQQPPDPPEQPTEPEQPVEVEQPEQPSGEEPGEGEAADEPMED